MTTTQQAERPLREIDETAERLQGTIGTGLDDSTLARPSTEAQPSTDERPAWDVRRARDIIERVAQDPASLLKAALVALGLVVIVAAIWSRRRPPRSAEELLLDRSRDALDHARETLESLVSRMPTIDR